MRVRKPWKTLKPTEKAAGVWKARWELAGGQVSQTGLGKPFCQILLTHTENDVQGQGLRIRS